VIECSWGLAGIGHFASGNEHSLKGTKKALLEVDFEEKHRLVCPEEHLEAPGGN